MPLDAANAGPETEKAAGVRLLADLCRREPAGCAGDDHHVEIGASECAHGWLAHGKHHFAIERSVGPVAMQAGAAMNGAPVTTVLIHRRAVGNAEAFGNGYERASSAERAGLLVEGERVHDAALR